MHSLEEIRMANLREAVRSAIEKITISKITNTDKVSMLVIEVLKVDQDIAAMQGPINIIGTTKEAMAQLQSRAKLQEELERKRRNLLSDIVMAIGGDLVAILIQHLTTKKEENNP